jgi:putative hydrolase of the HAD superfamily
MAGAVLLDFGGTLDADGVPWSQRLFQGYREQGGEVDRFDFEERFQRSDRMVEQLPDITTLGFRGLVLEQLTILRALLPDGDAIDLEVWAGGFVDASRETAGRNRGILGTIRTRYALAVVSNFTGNLGPCLAELELADCFKVVLDSAQLGIRKPDVR